MSLWPENLTSHHLVDMSYVSHPPALKEEWQYFQIIFHIRRDTIWEMYLELMAVLRANDDGTKFLKFSFALTQVIMFLSWCFLSNMKIWYGTEKCMAADTVWHMYPLYPLWHMYPRYSPVLGAVQYRARGWPSKNGLGRRRSTTD